MAENQRKIADPIDIDDEDPFAELTRIMGFDPRASAVSQPKEIVGANSAGPAVVTPITPKAAVSATTAPASAPVTHDEFGIDLEKELLGDFADFDLPTEPVAAAAPVAAPAFEPADAVIDDEFDHAFAETAAIDPMEAELAAAAESAIGEDLFAQGVAHEIVAHDAVAKAAVVPVIAEDAFDDAFAAELAGHAVQSAESPIIAHDDADDDFDDAIAAELAGHSVQSAVAAEPAVADDAFDDVVAAELGVHAAAEAADHDLIPDFDLGDLDLHRPLHEEAVPAPLAHAEIAVGTGNPLAVDEADAARAADALADVDMDFSAALDREFAPDADADDDDQAALAFADEPVATAAPATGAAADPIEMSLEDELSALLERDHGRPQARAPEAIAPAAGAPERGRAQFLSDPRWAALEADEEDEPVDGSLFARTAVSADRPDATSAEHRRPFGDPSLTSRHANFQLPQTAQPQPAEDLDDLLDAMESEVHATDPVEEQAAVYQAGPAVVRADDARAEPAAHEGARQPFEDYEDEAPAETGYEGAPDVETIDVPETVVAVADDLDIPELAYEEDQRQPAAYDDIDADFAANFNETATSEEPVNQVVRGVARPTEQADIDAEFEALYRPAFAQAAAAPAAAEQGHYQPFPAEGRNDGQQAEDYDDFAESEPQATGARDRFVDLDFDSDVQEEIAPALAGRQLPERAQRRGLLVAAVVGGVALLGGVGALALTFGGNTADTPVLVKADVSPVKVKPENPGGTTVPNQDNKVYDAVKGTAPATDAPAQEKLVTTAEEPVDMAAVDQADALPGVNAVEDIISKAEDRVDPIADADQDAAVTESIAVAPRKVKTMVVRSDGTLVAREEPAAPASTEAIADAEALPPANNDETGAVAAADDEPTFQSPGGDAVPVKPVKSTKVTSQGKPAASELPAKPVKSTKVIADGKPEAEPEESALPPANTTDEAAAEPAAKPAEAKPEQVASAEVEPTTVATGAWSVQIASQPSADSAKSTYQDLAQRFGPVIGGRGVNIVKAEIQGKGTYWRVRVPAKSRNEAVKLCTDYKAAGGNCFVSK